MWARISSPPMWATGVTSASRITAIPRPKQAIRQGGTGRPWLASVRARIQ